MWGCWPSADLTATVLNPYATMFFVPRIGQYYRDGFQGYRTLVLGAHHICLPECESKTICCDPATVATMDYRCPFYQKFDPAKAACPEDEMCLHNSNIIEIDAFCDDEAGYPAYSTFSKYLLGRKDQLTSQEKFDLWDHLAFTNLLQCYIPNKISPTYADNPDLYNSAIPALKELLEQIQPQIIYVWTKVAYEVIMAHIKQFDGLKQLSLMPEHPTMFIYKFSYRTRTRQLTVDLVRQYLDELYPSRTIDRSNEGLKRNVVPLEKALVNAVNRGILIFQDGIFLIDPAKPEKDGGHFVNQLRYLYTFAHWEEVGKLIAKRNSKGEDIPLRKIRHYNNELKENILSNKLDYEIFYHK